ncbi:hypothetical protein AGMMS49546_01260 [Spirochaetia bacterium]|nr:hypothetical protein AGMMS49546_01260 [Spirochaetia bacterium]
MQLDQVPVFEQIQAKSDNRAMEEYSADDFWKRYDMITGGKDIFKSHPRSPGDSAGFR